MECSLITNKVEDVKQLFDDHGLHILALTETWHESYDAFTIKRLHSMVIEEARSANKPHDCDRWINHGGVAVIARHGYRLTKFGIGETYKTFEWIGCRVSLGDMSFTLLSI